MPRAREWFWWRIFATIIFFLFLLLFGMVGITATRAVVNGRAWAESFADGSKRSVFTLAPELLSGFLQGRSEPLTEVRYLILGKDEVEGSGRTKILTDTMIVATYRPLDGKILLASIPRDVYVPEENMKVNGLYSEGMERFPREPARYPKEVLERITGLSFDGVLEISLSELQEIIDLVGGIELTVPRSFVDERYPRSGVDVTKERDPRKLYETVRFEAGKQHLDGETALKYIRTRYSTDPLEGNDDARTRRQQAVVEALIRRVATTELLRHPYVLGRLYAWYSEKYQAEISLVRLGAVIGSLDRSEKIPVLEKISLPTTEFPQATDSATLFVHPPVEKYRQWAYEPVDPTWRQFQAFFRMKGL